MKLPQNTPAGPDAPQTALPLLPCVAASGNLVLDRRRDWAIAATDEGQHLAAAEIYEQILERAPYWGIAWFELWLSRQKLGDRKGAISAFEAAAARDPDRLLAADMKLASLDAGKMPAGASANYIRGLFDQYAGTFDRHLVASLDYRGPAILRAAIELASLKLHRKLSFPAVYDLGCGTGLMAVTISGVCGEIKGADLSSKMIEAARRTGLYSELAAADIVDYLTAAEPGQADLVIAADVFVYLGELDPVFGASARVMKPGGLFAWSVQRGGDQNFCVGSDMRYAHSTRYLHELAARHGFEIVGLEEISSRTDRGLAVPGLAAVLMKA